MRRHAFGLALGLVSIASIQAPSASAQCGIAAPGISATAGSEVLVPFVVGDLTDLAITGYGIFVRFDAAVLEYLGSVACSGGVTHPSGSFNFIVQEGAEVHAVAASATPYLGSGCLFQLRFRIRTGVSIGTTTALDIYRAEFFPDRPAVAFDGGIGAAATAEIGLTPALTTPLTGQTQTLTAQLLQNGAPKSGAAVTFEVLAGPGSGQTATAATNALGEATFAFSRSQHGTNFVRVGVAPQSGIAAPLFSTLAVVRWRNTPTDVEPGAAPEVDAGLAARRIWATPNPFAGQTRVWSSSPNDSRLEIVDIRGRVVRRLVTRPSTANATCSDWDGRDDRGEPLPSGIYVMRVAGERGSAPSKLVLLR